MLLAMRRTRTRCGMQNAGRCGQGRGRQLHRRLFGAGAKGFSAGDERLIRSIPRRWPVRIYVCSSINVGSTKSGINMDAVKMMGPVIKGSRGRTRG